jgi:hypothetical protein
MSERVTTVLAIVLLFIGAPVLVLLIIDRRRNHRRREAPPATRLAERQTDEQRILNPDWTAVEHHLRRPVPQALRDLYADRELIVRRDLRYADDHVISSFEPLDEQAIQDATHWLGFEMVAIATTEFADTVYLRAGAAETGNVYLTHHDGGDTEVFAESVSEMFATLKQAQGAES